MIQHKLITKIPKRKKKTGKFYFTKKGGILSPSTCGIYLIFPINSRSLSLIIIYCFSFIPLGASVYHFIIQTLSLYIFRFEVFIFYSISKINFLLFCLKCGRVFSRLVAFCYFRFQFRNITCCGDFDLILGELINWYAHIVTSLTQHIHVADDTNWKMSTRTLEFKGMSHIFIQI